MANIFGWFCAFDYQFCVVAHFFLEKFVYIHYTEDKEKGCFVKKTKGGAYVSSGTPCCYSGDAAREKHH